MPSFQLRCSECGALYEERPDLLVCDVCSRQQERGGVTRGVLEVVLDALSTSWSAPIEEMLPLGPDDVLPPLQVGATPLLPVPGLRQALGLPHLWVKDDTRNPSGSTKDRASALVVAKARGYGFETVAAASTGNAATALAAVGAAAGMRVVVLVPGSAPEAKLVQMSAYGARVLAVDGSYDDAFELCLEACRRFGWYNRNTALNPYTIEGKKTAAVEIAKSLAPRDEADVVIVPTGDGVILAGLAKGFADLVDAGLLRRPPRLLAVQPAGSAGIVRAWEQRADTVEPVAGAHSVADSLTVEVPRNALLCLRRIRESGGAAVQVSDAAILEAIADLARHTGVFAEPAAAAALAGLRAALDQGHVERDERIVLLVTGTGLKDVRAAARAVPGPVRIAPDIESVAAAIG